MHGITICCTNLRKLVCSQEGLLFLSAVSHSTPSIYLISLALSSYFYPAAPVRAIVPHRRRAYPYRHACLTFSKAIFQCGGGFVPWAFLTRFWRASARGHPSSYWGRRGSHRFLGVIMDHTWSYSSGSPRFGASVWGHKPQSPWLCLLLFHFVWALLGLLSYSLGAQCLCIHSLSFVHSNYNLPQTSIPEMQWIQVFLFGWMCQSKESREEIIHWEPLI